MKKLLLKLLIAVLGNLLAPLYSYLLGKKNAENKNNSELLSQVEKANSVRDKLNRDPDFASRLRKKFSR